MPIVTLTATTPGPCACCGIGGVSIYCRTRGGTGSLVGCGEVITPSIPARAYRRLDNSGSTSALTWPNPTCTGAPGGSYTCNYGRWRQYDPVTGAVTTGGVTDCGGVIDSSPIQCFTSSDLPATCNGTWAFTQTTAVRSVTGTCCPDGFGNAGKDTSDTNTLTLSDEDTEADALTRLLAGAGGVWSAYTLVGDGSFGTCIATSCCQAHYQQRTTGFSFAYQESQFRADITLLDPATAYVLTMQVYRRLYGSSDPWVLLLESDYGFTTDGSGNYQVIDDVPNLIGYETYVCCPLIYKP